MADEQFPAAVTALEEYRNIEQQMAEPEVASDPDKMRKLGRRHAELGAIVSAYTCLLYTSPSPRDRTRSRMPSSA